jgi:hypothetical protein
MSRSGAKLDMREKKRKVRTPCKLALFPKIRSKFYGRCGHLPDNTGGPDHVWTASGPTLGGAIVSLESGGQLRGLHTRCQAPGRRLVA